jgi:hypothetical protein
LWESSVPSEIRHIVFSGAEIASAVREYRRQAGRPLPTGSLRRVEIGTNSGSVRVSLDIAPDNGIATSTWDVGSAEITEALVAYCSAHNVPLPAAGAKSLQRFGDSVLLIVALNVTGAGWPLSAGLARAIQPKQLPAAAD